MLDFVKQTRFDRLGAFTFSPEENTPAASMDGQIDEEVKQERLDRLMLLQQEISAQRMQERVGETCEVLVEGDLTQEQQTRLTAEIARDFEIEAENQTYREAAP